MSGQAIDPAFMLCLSRVFEAPVATVFRAWTDPELVKRWWGPRDFTVPFAEIDLREGGAYRIGMRRPDGGEHVLFGTYVQIMEPTRLVYTWSMEEAPGDDAPDSLVTVAFRPVGDMTEIQLTHEKLPPSKSAFDAHYFGWLGSLDRLEEMVAKV